LPAERILVVDDDENIRQIVRLCLSDEGFDVLEASNGQAALDAVGEFQPDLILLDLRMPVMDGWEFARRYENLPVPHVPIVAFVAALNAEQECADVPTAGIITKPFDLEDLLHAIRSQLPLAT
jgi:two-component system, chemotaxis family, chemotaxis protein CheY